MEPAYNNINKSIAHLNTLHSVFITSESYNLPREQMDFDLYNENLEGMLNSFGNISLFDQLYNQEERQMVLSDIIEYILLGRGFYSIGTSKNNPDRKQNFIRGILHFVNLLMCYESITININRRNIYLDSLADGPPSIKNEPLFRELREFESIIGVPDSTASAQLSKYFDKLLPKTAGGLWHELLVYIFLLRNDLGFIIPLLLHQKIYSLNDHLVPPDFLLITYDKRLYGIEVGIKKEIQSGSFSLKTAVPTATIDTINSRNSDRCPACKKWIGFCPFVIENYSIVGNAVNNVKVSCVKECAYFSRSQIINGECKYTKYARSRARTLAHSHHEFSDGKHYHYQCVLEGLDKTMRENVIKAEDISALKTHYPYYTGLEELM